MRPMEYVVRMRGMVVERVHADQGIGSLPLYVQVLGALACPPRPESELTQLGIHTALQRDMPGFLVFQAFRLLSGEEREWVDVDHRGAQLPLGSDAAEEWLTLACRRDAAGEPFATRLARLRDEVRLTTMEALCLELQPSTVQLAECTSGRLTIAGSEQRCILVASQLLRSAVCFLDVSRALPLADHRESHAVFAGLLASLEHTLGRRR